METFMEIWGSHGWILGLLIIAGAVVYGISYLIRFSAAKELKKRYDLARDHEQTVIWNFSITMMVGLILLINSLFADEEITTLLAKIFAGGMLALIVGIIINAALKYRYPAYLEKKLKTLRYTPRISPKSGKPMILLSEEEEDVYLDEGMQAEEDCFSVDYDVWRDEENDYTHIEKYIGHKSASECPECGYMTLKVVKEEIIESPTVERGGELMKYFNCGYCGYKTRKIFAIHKLKENPELGRTEASA
ncbi:MAG: hypothetical protein LAT68_05580 [Cyclobacteriaceae bacterium]|nr:hypothetical protein [Cyclobacteriaceae bacterium]MCH8515782.1 hypothetical protein [Cyclobacteriaceae bacterium]